MTNPCRMRCEIITTCTEHQNSSFFDKNVLIGENETKEKISILETNFHFR